MRCIVPAEYKYAEFFRQAYDYIEANKPLNRNEWALELSAYFYKHKLLIKRAERYWNETQQSIIKEWRENDKSKSK